MVGGGTNSGLKMVKIFKEKPSVGSFMDVLEDSCTLLIGTIRFCYSPLHIEKGFV